MRRFAAPGQNAPPGGMAGPTPFTSVVVPLAGSRVRNAALCALPPLGHDRGSAL